MKNVAKKRKRQTKVTKGRPKKPKTSEESDYDPTKLEDCPDQVLDRFQRGCECHDENCFKGLSPESVYRHRLNIADLTKAEHDMYLMGVTMACLTNPYETARHTERRRLRAHYVYQGRRVCLDAFLYLENCTHYQVKRIRKHVMTHGVTPRVHGNYGKVPHNTFSLDIYKSATEFLKDFIKKQEHTQKTKVAKNAPLHLPPDMTRKAVHDLYTEYCQNISPSIKVLGYSTFRGFMKVQFPQIKFAKQEFTPRTSNVQNVKTVKSEVDQNEANQVSECTQIVATNGDLVPVVITGEAVNQSNTYILTPLTKFEDGVNYHLNANNVLVSKAGFPVTLTNVNPIV